MKNETEHRELLQKRDALTLSKRDHETKLIAVKNVVRSGGRLPHDKYRQCCDSQNTHAKAIMHIESELFKVKSRLREIANEQFDEKKRRKDLAKTVASTQQSAPEKNIITELVCLRQAYQDFAADATRVSSMRQMAADFVLKLNPIIKRAIGND